MLTFSKLSPIKRIFFIFICIFFLATISWFVFKVEFLSWDFRNELWAPSYLLWHRESAYNTTVLFPVSLAVWFPQIIGVFFPLGLLSQYQATNLWFTINVGMLIYLVWLLSTRANKDKPGLLLFSVLLICVFLFPPTFKLLKLGQVDIIILGSVIAGTYALEQHRLGSGAFFYALAFTKPQLTIIVFPCLITYWLFIKKDWLYAAKFTFITFFLILILTIPLSISNTRPGYTLRYTYNSS